MVVSRSLDRRRAGYQDFREDRLGGNNPITAPLAILFLQKTRFLWAIDSRKSSAAMGLVDCSERLNVPDSKSGVCASGPRVRILLAPFLSDTYSYQKANCQQTRGGAGKVLI